MARILVVSLSSLARDPRVHRQISALAADHEVVAAGYPPPHEAAEFIDVDVRNRLTELMGRFELPRTWARAAGDVVSRRWQKAVQRDLQSRLIREILSERLGDVDLILVNDAPAIPLMFELAAGRPVVLDAHEYSPEQISGLLWKIRQRPLQRWVAREYFPKAAGTMTVCRSIAERYRDDTGIEPEVVINAPPYADLRPSPVGKTMRMVHFGGATRQRRLEAMIDVIQRLDDRFSLDFYLVGADQGYLHKLRSRAAGDPRVRFHEPVPMGEIVTTASQYDVGLYLLSPHVLNQRFALPNKFFEFIQGRLAVAIGPSPEMTRVTREWGCGIVAEDFRPASLAERLAELTPGEVEEMKQASHRAAQVLNAERNAEIIRSVVQGALDRWQGPQRFEGST